MADQQNTVNERLLESVESMLREADSKLEEIKSVVTYANLAKELLKYAQQLSEMKTGLLMSIDGIEVMIDAEKQKRESSFATEHTDYGPYDLKDTVQRRVDEENRKRRGK